MQDYRHKDDFDEPQKFKRMTVLDSVKYIEKLEQVINTARNSWDKELEEMAKREIAQVNKYIMDSLL